MAKKDIFEAILKEWVRDYGEQNAMAVYNLVRRGDRLVSAQTIAKRLEDVSAEARMAYHALQLRGAVAMTELAKANKRFQDQLLEALIRIGIAALL